MSKIVCDVCGTAYPETASQCPICGNAKSDTASAAGDTAAQDNGYAYLKGGRFSRANVRKRNSGKPEPPRTVVPAKSVSEKNEPKKPEATPEKQPQPETQQPEMKQEPAPEKPAQTEEKQVQTPEKQAPVQRATPSATPRPRRRKPRKKDDLSSNKGLIIIVVILIIAILAVCAFITVRLLNMNADPTDPTGTTPTKTRPTITTPTSSSTVHRPVSIPCTGVSLQMPSYTFDSVGETLLLDVKTQPKDTTDPILFESSDPYIASVDDKGVVVAVADGTVTITVKCGDFAAVCEITCRVGVEPTYPTEPPVTEPTVPSTPPIVVPPAPSSSTTKPFVKLELNRSDFTLNGYGSTHNLYSGQLDPASITWTSSDEKVATVENGIVTAVGNGNAVITAEYEGQRVTCIVRCTNAKKPIFSLSHVDVTIRVGGKFTLTAYAENEDGTKTRIDPSELKFTPSDKAKNHFTVDENGVITGVKNNINYYEIYKTLYVEYKGETLKCIVRISG